MTDSPDAATGARDDSAAPPPDPAESESAASSATAGSDDSAAAGSPASPDSADSPGSADSPDPDDEETTARPAETDALWDELGVQPVKIALPGKVGYTLRAYRLASQLEPAETDTGAAAEPEPTAGDTGGDEPGTTSDETTDETTDSATGETAAAETAAGEATDDRGPTRGATDEPSPEDFEDEPEAEEEPVDEEVPVFLSQQGTLLLFGSTESLVAFVRSGATTDLSRIDTWSELVERVEADDIVPTDADTYELDLVVENLRAGHDAWDPPLLIGAGEIARDIGWALRLTPVITALAAGSPLDDLDEALRAVAGGGVRRIFARRRLRRIGAQQASLGWRTVIGKISAAVDWRD